MAVARGVPDKYTAIIQAAVEVMARHGYENARMGDIAEAAGVATGTLYLYFKNKPDLVVTVFREKLGQMVRAMVDGLPAAAQPLAQLRWFVQGHLQALAAEPSLAVFTQNEIRQSDPEIRRRINAVMEEGYFAFLEALLRSGQELGAFRRDVDWRLIRNMVFGTLDQTVTAWVLAGCKWDLAAQAEAIIQLLSAAIAPERQGLYKFPH